MIEKPDRSGDSEEAVRRIQKKLIEAGCNPEKVDGILGEMVCLTFTCAPKTALFQSPSPGHDFALANGNFD